MQREPLQADARQPALILFDGVCNLCSWSVQFIIRRDPRARFRFASLQSPTGQRLLRARGLGEQPPQSVVLVEGGQWYTESGAALRIARHLSGAWPLLYALLLVPYPLRDAIYRLVARNRYRWFGKSDSCMLPGPGMRERFVDEG